MSGGNVMSVKKRRISALFLIVLLTVFLLFTGSFRITRTSAKENRFYKTGELKVHFIDTGQSDCILIESEGHHMLVDAGRNESGAAVVKYLRELGVERLDYVIGTHGHQDHIGGMDAVLYNFEVENFYIARQAHDTKSYRDIIDAVRAKNIEIKNPRFAQQETLGSARFTFITPEAEGVEDDLNSTSLGIRVTNGRHSFLMCADAGTDVEQKILKSGMNIKADVFKLNHHGSSDANSKKFLKKVSPKYAVVTCAKDNEFGHPHESVMKRLNKLDIKLFRTDEQGSVVFTSDGETLMCNVNPVE